MTPHRSGGRGTFMLDRRLRIGRLTVASGTNHRPTFRRLNEMLTALDETGRDDILRQIRDHQLKPLTAYEAFRVNELHRLPTGSEMRPLRATMLAWLNGLDDQDCSKAQRAAHKTAIKKLTERGEGTISDITGRLVLVGVDCHKEKHPAQFNRVRASALAFIRDTLKRSHRLYGEVRDVPLMKEKKSPEKHPLSWSELEAISEKMTDPRDNAALWGMALTGMGPKEWYIDGWVRTSSGIAIRGQKRSSRSRVVPAIYAGGYFAIPLPSSDVGAVREKRRFGERLLHAGGVRPYDLRRTYANWLEAAGIPRTRRKAYLGHAGGDVTSLYEAHEVKAFLSEDAERLERYLSGSERKGLEMVK